MARRQGGTLSGFTPLSTPNAPTGLSVSAGFGEATVSFVAPTDTGDGAVTSYIVTAIDESTGASTGATGSASPITVSPGIGTFKIRAQAVNGFGPGRLTEFSTGNSILFNSLALFSWGQNDNGQLGLNNRVYRSSPTQVSSGVTWTWVSGNYNHHVAARDNGTLWSWGNNNGGQLGLGDVIKRSSPTQVGALTNWYFANAGGRTSAAIKTDGTLWVWGYNGSFGKLGLGYTFNNRSSPVQLGALTDWLSVSMSSQDHTLALKTNGTLWAWGSNQYGRLGDNTTVSKSSPTQIGALTSWAQISAGNEPSFARTSGGALWAWGRNSQGALGNNSTTAFSSPIQVGSLTNWGQISASSDGAIAVVKVGGSLWAWGHNDRGQLGLNDTNNRSSPVQVGALTDWYAIDFGGTHCVSVKTDGTLWTWGSNGQGRLGHNDTVYRSSPTQVGAQTTWIQSADTLNASTDDTFAAFGVI